jgi:hypothetical protein
MMDQSVVIRKEVKELGLPVNSSFFKPHFICNLYKIQLANGVVHRQGRGRGEFSSSVGAIPGEVVEEDLQTEP